MLLITGESIEILPHDHLNRMNGGLMLSDLGLEICSEWFTVFPFESNRRTNVEIMKEVGDMKHNRVTSLPQSVHVYYLELVNIPL